LKFFSVLGIAIALLVIGGARAQDDPFPTVTALENVIVPVRDRIDLARRIDGLTDADLPSTPTQAPVYAVGDRHTFSALDAGNRRLLTIDATLRALGDHLALWVQDDSNLPDSVPRALVEAFDTRIYDPVRALWGSEDIPGIDGDPRVHALFARGLGGSTAGYFASDHTESVVVYEYSNEREMFFFNLDVIRAVSLEQIESIMAHEFQHMIRHNVQTNDDTWLNEGLSVFTESYLYGEANSSAFSYLLQPDTQLTDWNADPALRGANYGAAGLFMTYLYDRFGIDALIELGAHPAARAWSSVEAIAEARATHANALFADWLIANLWLSVYDAPDPVYPDGSPVPLYADLPKTNLAPPDYTSTLGTPDAIPPYSARHYFIPDLKDDQPLISISGDAYAPLIADSGDGQFWVSARADLSESRLTYAVDLTENSSARLNYRVWHDLETEWDYGYVMVSTDGTRWTPLQTARMTDADPNALAYGAGYTGVSGGWVDESLDLSAYTGGTAWVRFSVITDDAINRPGMAIDSVTVTTDTDIVTLDVLSAEGWIETDNRLLTEFIVQAIAFTNDAAVVTRTVVIPDGTLHLLGLGAVPGVESLWLIVSPVVPFTTEPIPYTLFCC